MKIWIHFIANIVKWIHNIRPLQNKSVGGPTKVWVDRKQKRGWIANPSSAHALLLMWTDTFSWYAFLSASVMSLPVPMISRLLLSSFCNGWSFRTLGLMLKKKQSPPAG